MWVVGKMARNKMYRTNMKTDSRRVVLGDTCQ